VDEKLLAILSGTVPDVEAALAALNPLELARLEELEKAGKNRAGVLNAIEDIILHQAGDPPSPHEEAEADKAPVADAGKEARGEEIPGYQKLDYSGPLTMDQAQWRNERIEIKDGARVFRK
jgi:hypothetical protein